MTLCQQRVKIGTCFEKTLLLSKKYAVYVKKVLTKFLSKDIIKKKEHILLLQTIMMLIEEKIYDDKKNV